ncbi:MAG: InlB B-repeat-containing protein [Dysgonomonas sp.]
MKKLLYILLLCTVFFSCKNTDIDGVDIDFDIDAPIPEMNGYVGKPVTLTFKVQKVDANNNYPMQFKITSKSGKIQYADTDTLTIRKDVFNDMSSSVISLSYIPTETIEEEFIITIKNQLVEKKATVRITTTSNYYSVYAENFSDKPLIDKRQTFDLVIKEAEASNGDSIVSYAKVIQGTGEVYNGEVLLNDEVEKGKSRLITGRNKITYLPRTEGESVIRFFFVNKWNNETYADVRTNAGLPEWEIQTESDTIVTPINDKTSFTLNIKEADIFEENQYTASYRMSSNLQDFSLNINSSDIKQGSEFSLKNGSNVSIITPKEEATGVLDLYVKDKYKQEKSKRLVFLVKLPTKPLVASLEKTSIQIHENEKATFKLTVSEANYRGTFKVKLENIAGQGTFTTDKEMIVSPGTHEIGYLPDAPGTHTFKITISDDNGQTKELNATVQVEKNPLITVTAQTGGAVSGGGSKVYGSNVVIAAVPVPGYTFTGWYENNKLISTNATYSFTVTKDRTFEARFVKSNYNVTLSAQTGGKVSGGGSFEYNSQITVAAAPNTGYTFSGWYEDGKQLSTSPSYQIIVTRDFNLEARFSKNKINVVANAGQGGSVTGTGAYDYNETATFKATPETNYTFDGWYENGVKVSPNATYTFAVTKERTLEARFIGNKYNVTVSAQAGGTATGTGSYNYGTSVTVKATVETNYTFDGWYEGNNKVSSSLTYTFTVSKNISLEARFTAKKFTVTVNALAGGTATGSGTFSYNSNVTINATPSTGHTFDGWYEGSTKVSTSLAYTFVLKKDITLEARFSANKFNVIVNAQEGGSATGGGSYNYGTNITLQATVNAGYTFAGWYLNNSKISDALSYTLTVTQSATYEARFTINRFNVIVNAGTGGSVSGAGTYNYNANVTVNASPSTHYTFDGWYEGSTKVSTSLAYTFKCLREVKLDAKFIINKYKITTAGVNGVQTGAGSYDYNTNATVKATANSGYSFTGWYEGNSQVSTSNPFTFKVEKDRILEARYQLNKFTVTLNADLGGTVTGGGQFGYGTDTKLKATPNVGYTFDGWYEGTVKISGDNPYTLTVVKDRTITAKFNINKYTLSLTAETGGTVTGAGTFEHNKPVTVRATPTSDYIFSGWYEGSNMLSNNASYTFNITKNTTLVAKFEPKKFTVQVSQVGVSNAIISGQGSYSSGTSVTVKATPPTEADFDGWYENGNKVSSNINYTFIVKNNVYLEARFNVVYYTITIIRSTGGGCSSAGYQEQVTSQTIKRGESIRHSAPNFPPGNTMASWCGWYTYEGTKWTRITGSNVLDVVPDQTRRYYMHWYSNY